MPNIDRQNQFSSFLLYKNARKSIIQKEFGPYLSEAQIIKIASEKWEKETQEIRDIYIKADLEDKALHKPKLYPLSSVANFDFHSVSTGWSPDLDSCEPLKYYEYHNKCN
ncbi:hypothetical protein HDV01_006982 [Terramyces sp. JEL0728]|nr:hypothetical protein HDV01_006982 [Terramyces sp. JEL0728]